VAKSKKYLINTLFISSWLISILTFMIFVTYVASQKISLGKIALYLYGSSVLLWFVTFIVAYIWREKDEDDE